MDLKDEYGAKHSIDEVQREQLVHGSKWQSVYGGYFADPEIAQPFLTQIDAACTSAPPDIVIDLGGGTGFVLEQLECRPAFIPTTCLINLDISEEQQNCIGDSCIKKMVSSMVEFQRHEITGEEKDRILFITRSTLHYAGIFGIEPVLAHIRRQMRPGEYFVHQTLCHEEPYEALLFSEFLERLHTSKWIPPVSTLRYLCNKCGFEIEDSITGPTLPLLPQSLMSRYKISNEEMEEIHQTLKREYPGTEVIKEEESTYTILAPFKIFRCRAV